MYKKEILFFDMDNVLVDFQSGLDQVSDELKAQYADDGTGKPHYDDIPGIFSLMKPKPGAVEFVKDMAFPYDVYILSTAPWGNPSAWSDKLKWVKKYFDSDKEDGVFYKRLILTHHKDLCYRPDAYLIDDRPNNGAEAFGDHWLSFGENGEYKDWDKVKTFLINRKRYWLKERWDAKIEVANKIADKIHESFGYRSEKCFDLATKGEWWYHHQYEISELQALDIDSISAQIIADIESGKID